ncbi:MAG: CoA transferase [Elusimicrobiota bacterium]
MRGLNKFTVLDFSKLLPGPFCTMLLADLGCRVIRVELPHWPDMLRGVAPHIEGHGFAYWMANRNKESLCLDFRRPAGLQVLMQLLAKSDALVEGYRPGMMEKLGLGPKTLRRKFPRLVYCSLTGYGRRGPLSRRAGHDINFLAESGFMGAGDSNKTCSFPQTQIADLCASQAASTAILAALLDRVTSGRGQHIDISMTEAIFSWLVLPLGHSAALRRPYDIRGPQWWSGNAAFYRLYDTQDGRAVCVAAVERPFAEALLRELGRPDLIARLPKLDGSGGAALTRTLARIFRSRTLRQWEARLRGKDVCVTPVRTVEEARRLFMRPPAPGAAPLVRGKAVRSPIRLAREDCRMRRRPPRLGADNEAVLKSFRIPRRTIKQLETSGLLVKKR